MKKEIRTDKAPLPGGPYSQGLRVGNRVYVAGQRPVNAQTGEMPESFTDQAKQALENVRHVLEEGGATLDDVVKVSVFLADMAHFAAFNDVYRTFFTAAPYPTRTTVCCTLRGIQVEVDAIAEIAE